MVDDSQLPGTTQSIADQGLRSLARLEVVHVSILKFVVGICDVGDMVFLAQERPNEDWRGR
jgi:hypothetical protein